jgi:LysM repeat protein
VKDGWQRYAAPAAFLLAVTIAVILVRAGFESGHPRHATTTTTTTTTTTARRSKPTTTPTTTAATGPKSVKKFVTVQAGDTFSVISARTHVPVATIERLNPKVASTTLHIGEQIRIK